MKNIIFALILIFSHTLFAQTKVSVNSNSIDLAQIRETLGDSTRKVILKLSSQTPKKFKVHFEYQYRFKSEKLDGAYVGPAGDLVLTTRPEYSEIYTGKNTLQFDISDSMVSHGEEIELLVEISKPNKDIHGVSVNVSVLNNSEHSIKSSKRLLGLLSRHYELSLCL